MTLKSLSKTTDMHGNVIVESIASDYQLPDSQNSKLYEVGTVAENQKVLFKVRKVIDKMPTAWGELSYAPEVIIEPDPVPAAVVNLFRSGAGICR